MLCQNQSGKLLTAQERRPSKYDSTIGFEFPILSEIGFGSREKIVCESPVKEVRRKSTMTQASRGTYQTCSAFASTTTQTSAPP